MTVNKLHTEETIDHYSDYKSRYGGAVVCSSSIEVYIGSCDVFLGKTLCLLKYSIWQSKNYGTRFFTNVCCFS